jgi:hypothetical protein
MIIFDMECEYGHVFEGWFATAEDCDGQLQGGLLTCPVCGTVRVARVPSTFGIVSQAGERAEREPAPSKEVAGALLARKMAEFMRQNFDNVGSDFAKEALKIHYGAAEPRNIRGTSTAEEEKMLDSEGVTYMKVPVPRDDSDA